MNAMKQKNGFRDRVVWITGASSGIGEALARRLNEQGARLILSSNEPEELKRARLSLPNRTSETMLLSLDLDKPLTLGSKAARVLDRFGYVDVLINNGGISQRALAKDTSLEVDMKIINTDFLGHVALTKAVLPSMLARRSGHIVVTSSIMGKIYSPLRSTYTAAKHALHGFFDSLRAEVAADNILVTIVCPTGVKTGISLNAVTGEGKRYGKMDDLMSRGLTADECADRIVKAVAAGKEEVIIGKGLIKYSAYVRRFFPRIYSRLIRRMKVT
jgi:dehydrogenase/reductase SDR family protein 7B